MYSMKYLLIWVVFLVLFYIFLRWVIRRTPVTEDDGREVRGISSSFKERAGDTFYGAIYYLCSAFLIDKIVGFLDNTPLMP